MDQGKWPDPETALNPKSDLGCPCYEGVRDDGFTLPLAGQSHGCMLPEPPFLHLPDEPGSFMSRELHEEGREGCIAPRVHLGRFLL